MVQNQSKAYKTAMADKAYLKFRPKMFSCSGYTKAQFDRAAWYSLRPTLRETGIGIGGFKKPEGAVFNVKEGDIAEVVDGGPNNGRKIEVIRYAGENPKWQGVTYCEDAGPCWIIRSLGEPFEVDIEDQYNPEENHIKFVQKLPFPDEFLKTIASKKRKPKD